MATREEKQLIIAEAGVLKAAKVLDLWFKDMLKEKVFSVDDMSDSELDFMETVKELRKAERKVK